MNVYSFRYYIFFDFSREKTHINFWLLTEFFLMYLICFYKFSMRPVFRFIPEMERKRPGRVLLSVENSNIYMDFYDIDDFFKSISFKKTPEFKIGVNRTCKA